uniref:BHLH domain-containing protein n=1 Tax=Zea mays TaxID=4577 RepID=A0A804LI54_MAIZE
MWNCSSLLLQYGDDYARCESSSSPAGAVGLDRILAAEYGRFDSLDLSPPPPLHGLQAQTLFAIHGSSENCLGIGANPIYSTEARPAFSQLSFTQPAADTAAHYSMKWTAAGETATGGGGSRLRGSKRLKTKTPATAQGPQHHGQRCSPKPTTSQSIKAPPCKRSQKLGDKITALQQLVSPYGKTDTASVLHEAATCIKHLHEQIQVSRWRIVLLLTQNGHATDARARGATDLQQVTVSLRPPRFAIHFSSLQILTASYPELSSPASQQDTGDEEGGATGLRRRGLCVASLSPAVVQLVSAEAALGNRDTEDHWRWLGTL